jgi:polyisoprenoid-binding protein YceI
MTSSTTVQPLVPAGLWTVDPVASSARFSVRHLLVATVRGCFHDIAGTVQVAGARLDADGAVAVASIDTGDGIRDERLRSDGFFDAARHPELRFRATEAVAGPGGAWRVTGGLTTGAGTHPLTFEATARDGDRGPVVTARAALSRREHGLDWPGLLHSGRAVVGDRVDIELELVLR